MKIILNNRHKAGLFLTTVVAGLCLIFGENLRETIGGIIIGFALTWAFGSTNRVLRCCIGGLAILSFIAPLVAALFDHHSAVQNYEKSVGIFRSRLPELAKEPPDFFPSVCVDNPASDPYAALAQKITGLPPGAIVKPLTPSRTVTVPNTGDVELPCSMSDKDIAKTLRLYPEKRRAPSWYLEALDAGVSPYNTDQLTPPLDKPEPFDIKHVISDGALIEIPSALLAILFFGSVIAEAKRFTSHSNKPLVPRDVEKAIRK